MGRLITTRSTGRMHEFIHSIKILLESGQQPLVLPGIDQKQVDYYLERLSNLGCKAISRPNFYTHPFTWSRDEWGNPVEFIPGEKKQNGYILILDNTKSE